MISITFGGLSECEEEEQKKKSRRRRATIMTTTEALRLQLDILQREKQELEVRNLKLTDNPSRESLKEVEKERDHWKDE